MRKNTIYELQKFFRIEELVCPHIFKAFGGRSWQFISIELLTTLLVLRRDIFQSPMTVNNWHNGGIFSQRGYRCNICQIPRTKTLQGKIYLSAHCNGRGIDADIKGLTAEQARQKIKANIDKLPYNIRVEAGVSWLHLDTYDNGDKYSEFIG
jgi:hypothetical protein